MEAPGENFTYIVSQQIIFDFYGAYIERRIKTYSPVIGHVYLRPIKSRAAVHINDAC